MQTAHRLNYQEMFPFSRAHRHAIEDRFVEGMPGLLARADRLAIEAGLSADELALCRALIELLAKSIPGSFVDLATCAKEIVSAIDSRHFDMVNLRFSKLIAQMRSWIGDLMGGVLESRERNRLVDQWFATMLGEVQVEFALSTYWTLATPEEPCGFERWLDFLRVERWCEQVSMILGNGRTEGAYAVFIHSVQEGQWLRDPRVSWQRMEPDAENTASFTLRIPRSHQPELTVILHRSRGDRALLHRVANELALRYLNLTANRFEVGLKQSLPVWEKMNSLYRKAIVSAHPNDLFALIVREIPLLIHLSRAALFVYVPAIDAFKGVYGYHMEGQEFRRVLEDKKRFLEICNSVSAKPAVIAAKEFISANYVKEFQLSELLVVPIRAEDDIVAILLMDNDGAPLGLKPAQLDLCYEVKMVIEDILRTRLYHALLGSAERLQQPLTRREIEIINLIAKGLENKEIAISLHIGLHTVREHVSNILAKLGAANRTQAVVKALRMGLISD